ncbi:MAG: hypothetical protein IPJ98_17865 [Bryobacterales bacterium]|nr:hypothetical protein [Bryobacterales bacterium]
MRQLPIVGKELAGQLRVERLGGGGERGEPVEFLRVGFWRMDLELEDLIRA